MMDIFEISFTVQRCNSIEEIMDLSKQLGWSELERNYAISERFGSYNPPTRIGFYEKYHLHLQSRNLGENNVIDILTSIEETHRRLNFRSISPNENNRAGYGLVVGRIQSGKTAHMIGLTLRLMDDMLNQPSEKVTFTIVLSGLIEDLRQQPLKRFNSVGLESITIFPCERDFTSSNEDAKSSLRRALKNRIPSILVIKKDYRILEELINVLKSDSIFDELLDHKILIIDDECDHASIDSTHTESESDGGIDDITRTNQAVRRLISNTSHGIPSTWYLGYSATPYSNILMEADPEFSYADNIGLSLFPRDMIHCLEQPSGHFDNEQIFIGNGSDYITRQEIPDIDSLGEKELVESLILKHIVTKILKRRLDENQIHHTTMIHTSQRVDDHLRLAEIVRHKLAYLETLDANDLVEALRQCCQSFYVDHIIIFEEIISSILGSEWASVLTIISEIELVVLNGDNQTENPEYMYPDQLKYLDNLPTSIIVVGGQKLSRGLTLEGLVISWFARESNIPKYDTLLQMSRWCGYRGLSQELIRIHLNQETISHFFFITEVESRLRRDLTQLDSNSNPLDYVHWIREYDGMEISGRIPHNIIRRNNSGSNFRLSFEILNLPESGHFNERRNVQKSIYESFMDFSEFDLSVPDKVGGYKLFRNINYGGVLEFLTEYHRHYILENQCSEDLGHLLRETTLFTNGLDWNIAISDLQENRNFDGYRLSNVGFLKDGLVHTRISENLQIIDLNGGIEIRHNPLLVVHLEDPHHKIAGIPVYSDNGFPVPLLQFFLPTISSLAPFTEIARPDANGGME